MASKKNFPPWKNFWIRPWFTAELKVRGWSCGAERGVEKTKRGTKRSPSVSAAETETSESVATDAPYRMPSRKLLGYRQTP